MHFQTSCLGYPHQPSASADNSYLSFDSSWYQLNFIQYKFNCLLQPLPFLKQVDDVQLNLEKEKAQVSALEKKQRKFDQVGLAWKCSRGVWHLLFSATGR